MDLANIRITGILILIVNLQITDNVLLRELKKRPHIVLIVADDLGWNDVGFHGSIQIPTPNIDALAYHGAILNRHYVLPTCTPSRAALLTGKYPIRYGFQGPPIAAGQAKALPTNETILPQYLKGLGYSTHLVGKWHLGCYQKRFTPTQRGFDSHFGFWNGYISYRNSTHATHTMNGIDARRGFERAGSEMDRDRYATDVFTEEALKIIESSKQKNTKMFLMVSHLAVHSGNKGPNHLEVSNKTYNDEAFSYIENENRRLYAGMLTSLDDSVGKIIESLHENEMLKDSIVVFMSDNGAATDDPLWGHENFGSNWPLRGKKGSVHEGGVRGVAAIWSPWLKQKNIVSKNLFHITDWLPTLYTAAGGNFEDLGKIDGVDQWKSLTDTLEQARSNVLINIDEKSGEEALIFNQWKVVKSNRTSNMVFNLKYGGDPGNEGPEYNMSGVVASAVGSRLSEINCLAGDGCINSSTAPDMFYVVRSQAKVDGQTCPERVSNPKPDQRYECFDGYCLFDTLQDPCEYRNVAEQNPQTLEVTIQMLERFKREMTKQPPTPITDPDADPLRFAGYWDNWLEPFDKA